MAACRTDAGSANFLFGPEIRTELGTLMNRLIAVACLGFVALHASAAQKKPSKAPAVVFLPLDKPCVLEESGTLGPKFEGHSGTAILQLFGDKRGKDEYESKAQYEERLAAAIQSAPAAVSQGLLCTSKPAQYWAKFDAEAQTMDVTLLIAYQTMWFGADDLIQGAKVESGLPNTKDSTYAGSTAFGASAEVAKTTGTTYWVGFDKSQLAAAGKNVPFSFDDGYSLHIRVPMAGTEARALGDDLGIAYSYALASPYFGHNYDRQFPKFDSPFDVDINQQFVLGRLNKIALYNTKTGAIIKVVSLAP